MQEIINLCPLCQSTHTTKMYDNFPTYQENLDYSIYYCKDCDMSFANPLVVPENIYKVIYDKGANVPGYNRYFRYSDEVLQVKNPLYLLAEYENIYWGVRDFILKNATNTSKILEVGCGLGYLTYAIHKAGYNVKGIDISAPAITNAKQKYGDTLYECVFVEELIHVGIKYDIIIFTEVIEHIENPLNFIANLKQILTDKGAIILTTPCKDSCPDKHEYWNTELPPVHLFWFSKKSISRIGAVLNLKVDFTDLRPFIYTKNKYVKPWRTTTFSETGELLFMVKENALKLKIKHKLISYKIWKPIKKIAYFIKNNISEKEADAGFICAVLTNS